MKNDLELLYERDLKKIIKLYKNDDKEFVFKILVTSWFLQQDERNLQNLEKYVINKEKIEIKGIDIAFLNKGVLHLIKIKNDDKFENLEKEYTEGKFAAFEIWTILTNPYISSQVKYKKTGINKEIIEAISILNYSVNSNFFIVVNKFENSNKYEQNSFLNNQGENEILSLFDVIKYGLKNINNGEKSQKILTHSLSVDSKDLITHNANNIKSIIVKIKIREIMNMVAKEKMVNHLDSLFEGNIRFTVKKATISKEIKTSLIEETENFFFLNNGLSILVDKLNVNKKLSNNINLDFENPVIVNGQQTIRTLDNYFIKNESNQVFDDAYIMCRFYDLASNKDLANRIPYTSNNQNKVGKSDLIVLCEFHNKIKNILMENNIFYKYKTGKSNFDKWSKIIPNEITYDNLAKILSINLDNKLSVKNSKIFMHDRIWESIYLPEKEVDNNDLESIKLIKRLNEEKMNEQDKELIIKSSVIFILMQEKKINIENLGWGPSFDAIYFVIFKLLKNENIDFIIENIDMCFNKIIGPIINYFEYLNETEKPKEKSYLFKQEKYLNQFQFFIEQISDKNFFEDKLNNLLSSFNEFKTLKLDNKFEFNQINSSL